MSSLYGFILKLSQIHRAFDPFSGKQSSLGQLLKMLEPSEQDLGAETQWDDEKHGGN